ncbi:heme peroxidase [Epithele typhae]|uniref:heme peroxidase n=1 Tax=Epithele typhae TaxID=378194 RepID=UPI0020087E3C|nr:heme peroxidase [Epithele typhae]KAH9920546.1 heme peroxidase [Epithele typhae]
MLSKTLLPLLSLATLAVAAAPPSRRSQCSNSKYTAENIKCCVWYEILDDLQENVFDNGQCIQEAHEALRLTFHDAIGFSIKDNVKGGADGSIMAHSDIELLDVANGNIDDILNHIHPLAIKYPVSFGDFIQFTGAVGTANCKGAPRLEFLAGRSNSSVAAPPGLIPAPFQDVTTILARMADATFSPEELVALMASHSVAARDAIADPSQHARPFDTTPDAFDAQFFVETLLVGKALPTGGSTLGESPSPILGEIRLASDGLLARDPRTACEWQSFVTDHEAMNRKFKAAMAKLAVLGHDRASLHDCSEVIPMPKRGAGQQAVFPPETSIKDIEQSCKSTPFPILKITPGKQLVLPIV